MSGWGDFPKSMTVGERAQKAKATAKKLEKKGKKLSPVVIEGKKIANSFWGEGWCTHLEGFGDFESRLPRGRSYVRHGSVIHLEIEAGKITAKVQGSDLYDVTITIKTMPAARYKKLVASCTGKIESMVELLKGALNDATLKVLTDPRHGLFPQDGEIEFDCSCPDGAWMCKHVAAVLYGVGARLDTAPELLFTLRSVDQKMLVGSATNLDISVDKKVKTLRSGGLADVFGIEMEDAPAPVKKKKKKAAARHR